jgi:hypothetical protein
MEEDAAEVKARRWVGATSCGCTATPFLAVMEGEIGHDVRWNRWEGGSFRPCRPSIPGKHGILSIFGRYCASCRHPSCTQLMALPLPLQAA